MRNYKGVSARVLWPDLIYGAGNERVQNPFSGESVTLTPEAASVYYYVKGAEYIGDYDTVREGVAWFRANFPSEYMILLD